MVGAVHPDHDPVEGGETRHVPIVSHPPADRPFTFLLGSGATLAPMRILVVDDEPAVREAVERALRLEGHDVALAADGGQALDALGAWPADAVVLDVLMPRVDGLEACRRMRLSGDR